MTTQSEVRYRRGYGRADCTITLGQVLIGKQGARIVTRVEEPIDTDDGQKPWSQEYETKPCTAEEAAAANRATRIVKLEKQQRALAGPPDDDRDYDRVVAQRVTISEELAELRKV